jgi:lipopolysaccharide export system permease protein
VKILHKYVLKEHLGPLLFAFSALTSILLLQTVAKQFGNLVGKGLPASVIAQFFALTLPYTLALSMPMGVLVSTLYAFSRLASENEITALKASGVSMSRIMTPVLLAASCVTVLMLFFNDQILPRTNHQLSALMSDIAQTKPTLALREQIINEVTPGRLYLRANHIEASRLMREVTIYDMSDVTRRRTIIADSGTLGMAPNRTDLLMTLYHGVMQDVPTATPLQLQRLFFETDLIRVKGVASQFQKSTVTENRGTREQSVCQMQASVEKATQEYDAARNAYLQNLQTADMYKVKIPPLLREANTKAQPRVTLGGLYCSLLKRLGVPELQAQSVRPPRPVALPRNLQHPVKRESTGTRRITPQAARLMLHNMQEMQRRDAPVTAVVVDNARVRLNDARTTINMIDVEIHKKFALAVACFVFVLLGAPIALRFPRGGVGLTIGVSLLVFAMYYIGLIAGASLGSHGIVPPWIAMWAANVIFGAVGIFMVSRMGKEGNTARGSDFSETLEKFKRRFRRQAA